VGDATWNLSCALAWVTLPLSLLNTVRDLSVVGDWIRAWVRQLLIQFPSLEAVAALIHDVLDYWRAIVLPIRIWIEALIGFSVPPLAFDMAVIAAAALPSLIRSWIVAAHSGWVAAQASRALEQATELSSQADDLVGCGERYIPCDLKRIPELRRAASEQRRISDEFFLLLEHSRRKNDQATMLIRATTCVAALGALLLALDIVLQQLYPSA
jgi:hypothetical protein